MKRIKELIDSDDFHPAVYVIAKYDFNHEYDLKQEDKEDIIESYRNLFRLVRDIKEIVDKEAI